jgi:hypothetical protein
MSARDTGTGRFLIGDGVVGRWAEKPKQRGRASHSSAGGRPLALFQKAEFGERGLAD